jgi:hypothetical protein
MFSPLTLLARIIGGLDAAPISNPTQAMQSGWDSLMGIFDAIINGITNVINSFFRVLFEPLKGLADTFVAWWQGLQGTISKAWGAAPIFVGIAIILIIGGIIWGIIRWERRTIEGWLPEMPTW